MSKLKKIFISCCTFIFILIVPFSIYADENPTLEWGGYGEPQEYVQTRAGVTKPVDNSSVCTDFDSLSAAQKQYVLDIATNLPFGYGLIFMNTNGQLISSYGVWIHNNNGNLSILGHSNLQNTGIFEVYEDGTKSSLISSSQTIKSIFLLTSYVSGYANLGELFNITSSPCDLSTEYTLTVNTNDSLLGSVIGSGTYPKNSEVTVSASAYTDARFVSWSNGSTENPYTFTLTSNTTLTAIFESTIVAPNLNLPTPNEPNYSVDIQQNQMISTNGSPGIRGGQIYSFNVDYYNIYSVVQTAETDEFFSNRNNNYYTYQLKDGKYIFPVYQYSELQVYAPNMNVSGAYIPIEIKYSELIPNYSYIILADDSNVIQRDVSSFSTKYIDSLTSDVYSFDKLPFSNSSNNENHLEFLGTAAEGGYTNFNASSVSIELSFKKGINTTLYFVITDTTSSIENAQMMTNQATINNNMIQNFENVNNSIVSGTSNSQLVESNNNQSNQLLNNTISNYDQLEQGFKDDLDDHLGNLEIDFKFGSITDFTKTASFVRTQFDNLTGDNPFGLLIGFSLAVGISLLIIGKRL